MKKNKGFILISSLFLVFFLGLLTAISLMRSNIQLSEIDLKRASMSAFYAAETGIEEAIDQLRKDQTWRDGIGTVDTPVALRDVNTDVAGYYFVRVLDGGLEGNFPIVWLRSQGFDAENRVTRIIQAKVVVQNPAAYFMSSLYNLTIGSNVTIGGGVLGRDVTFDVNYALPPAQRVITVNGDVEYTRNIAGQADPNVTVTGNIIQRDPITFVNMDLGRYTNIAQTGGKYEAGDFTYSGEINWANLGAANGLVFAEGNVYISGEVTQSVHIVSRGNIYIQGDITSTDTDGDGNFPQIGLSAYGEVIIPQSAPDPLNIDAFVITNGGLFRAEGAKFSKNTLNFEGVIAAEGTDAARTAIDLNVYSQRNYTYDTALRDNLQIPFMSFIANIVEWKEVNPSDPFPLI